MPRNKSEKEVALVKAERREFEGQSLSKADMLKAYRRLKKSARVAKKQQRRSNDALLAAATGALSAWAARYAYEQGRNGTRVKIKEETVDKPLIDPDLAVGAALALASLARKEDKQDGEE